MFSRTAAPMTVQGPRKGEPSSRSMRNRLRPQPARLVRGSSRRIMSMRFRPANIRVIHRRASSSTVIGPAVRTEVLKAHQRERVPAPPPVEIRLDARTVLAGKGPLRRAQHRRALARSAPFRPDHRATGGSGGNTSPLSSSEKGRAGSPPGGGKPAWLPESNCQHS
jgi:hypothetical protein